MLSFVGFTLMTLRQVVLLSQLLFQVKEVLRCRLIFYAFFPSFSQSVLNIKLKIIIIRVAFIKLTRLRIQYA